MPNGHSGIPRWGLPLVLLGGTVVAVRWFANGPHVFPAVLALVLAALGAWRFSFHLTMWDATEYGGAYTDDEMMQSARRKHLLGTVASVVVALVTVGATLLALAHEG